MDSILPQLIYKDLEPTRDYLREASLVLSSRQRGFIPKHPRQWQYGLEVGLRGLSTQPFTIKGDTVRASLDLVRHKVRLGDNKWALHEYAAPEILAHIKAWLESRGETVKIPEPTFKEGIMMYDTAQADAYSAALWWMDEQFRSLKAQLHEGITSPILLYPHHFDLSLAWFPYDDERQLGIGWSTGDEIIAEPYVYLSAYPEPAGLRDINLPPEARWQSAGFSGAILLYSALQTSAQPAELFKSFASPTLASIRQLI